MPEYPTNGYAPYRLWGYLPADVDPRGPLARAVDWLLGRSTPLLYLGITCRAGYVRWAEHSDTKDWAGDVVSAERDDSVIWPTLNDAVLDRGGRVVLVLDDRDPEGVRPARPDELVTLLPGERAFRGELVDLYQLDPAGRPARKLGDVIEGATTGERRMIREERPARNDQHNEGHTLALTRRRRILPRHVAVWRRQAATLAVAWAALAAVLGWSLREGTGLLSVVLDGVRGVAAAAVAILFVQLVRLATRGHYVAGPPRQRRRGRRPA